jgi:hypothetical protein
MNSRDDGFYPVRLGLWKIKKVEDIDGAYVEFPFDVAAKFGTQGRLKGIATFDGVEYRGGLVKMKTSCHIIVDTENRVSAMPDNLRSVLAQNRGAADFFHSLTANQKNKFIDFITVAKKQETADSRLEKVAQMLEQKEKMK